MADDFKGSDRLLYRAELGVSVQQAKREELAQRVTMTQPDIMEFYNKNHGKGGRFSSGKGSGGGGGSLSDKRTEYDFTRGDRDIFEFEVAEAKQHGGYTPKELRDLEKTAKSVEPMIARTRKDLFDHVDALKNDGGRKARKELDKQVKSTDQEIEKTKGHIKNLTDTGDTVMDKLARSQMNRHLGEEQSYRDHLTGKT